MTVIHTSRRSKVAVLAVVAALAVGACSSGGTSPSAIASAIANGVASEAPTPEATPVTSPSAEPSTAPTDEPSESALPSAVATAISPCDVITRAEASSWVGVKFGAGKETKTEGNVGICTYAAAGPNLFSVEYAIAPDEATAKAAEAAEEADLESQTQDLAKLGLSVTKLPGFAPNTDAAILQGGMSQAGISIAARAMFVLRGTTFFAFSDVAVGGGQPPTEQQFKDKANELLAKLP
jgi:hypothetical protein